MRDKMVVKKILQNDNRRFRRVDVELLGKLLLPDRTEHNCVSINISAGGALVATRAIAKVNDKIIINLDVINQLEAVVVRNIPDDKMALKFFASSRKREQIVNKLTWMVNQKEFSGLEARRHKRESLDNVFSIFAISVNHVYSCQIVDLSISGAAIRADTVPPVGTHIKLGQTLGVVVRHIPDGFAIQFKNPITDLSDVLPD